MHGRYALPLTCLIVVWVAVPLGLRVNRRGPLMSVGLSLGCAAAFFILMRLSLALGDGGRVPPLLAAWLPNICFTGLGAVLLARAR